MRIKSSRLVQLAACAAFVVASSPLAMAAAPTTVKGEVVDSACYKRDKANMGTAHKGCTEDCAKKGHVMSLVTSDGQVYAITGDYAANKNEKMMGMLSVPVEATGEVSEKDGTKQLNVTAMKKAS